jgi:hypothetical protein
MFKFAVGTAVLGLFLVLAGPSFAGGYGRPGSHHGGAYYHHGSHVPPVRVYDPYYPPARHHGYGAPYMVARPVYVPPPVYRPSCYRHGYYGPSSGLYIQGRNFSFGIDY